MPRTKVRLMRNAFEKMKKMAIVKKVSSGLMAVILLGAVAGCSELPNSYEARLADYLTETDAKMYGAYWCPHCAAQKDYFGGAASRIPYIECDPAGFDAQVELCDSVGIEAYPTWIIKGEYYLGAQPLGELATLSGFDSAAD